MTVWTNFKGTVFYFLICLDLNQVLVHNYLNYLRKEQMMENNLISDEERRKEKEKMNRLMDSELRLRTIHELRWILLGLSEDIKDHDVYIEGQEILSEMERQVWKYINGEIENY